MAVRVGINGFGRIGRSFTRALLARGGGSGVELVAVNDPMGDNHTLAFLLKHDSVGGVLQNSVEATDDGFAIDGTDVRRLGVMDPAEIPWIDHDVNVVVESTGLFTAREKAAAHLGGPVERVVISAPSGDADATICMGVNDDVFDSAQHSVISNASCTTNCLAPLAKVLHTSFGIEQGLMTTVHAYTSEQSLVDLAKTTRSGKPDLRRMRAAALSIIPTTTGAARAIGLVLPELQGKLDGTSLRVPTPTGSITDLSAQLATSASVDEVNDAFAKAAADASYRGVLEYSDEELVSADIVGNPASCIYSSVDTMANGSLVKVLGWYDNEWGYSNRLIDLIAFVGA
ncbi:MAG TPA: type I glyceraldehyde-3-phosphate dehydrogenase [Acidimicrobiia bacterium]